jgi:hypothetical protein
MVFRQNFDGGAVVSVMPYICTKPHEDLDTLFERRGIGEAP